jgi:pimeloyl-ACP methyl ester carboxylesterase
LSGSDFEATGRDGAVLRGTREGEGPPILLAHGLTAHRELVVHGSRALSRAGYDLIRYDARAHGQSDPGDQGSRTYEVLADDMEAVIAATVEQGDRPLLAGHSMGAHTLVAYALRDPDSVAGIVVIGPAVVGTPPTEDSLEGWDALAEGLRSDGIDGFIEAYSRDLDPDWSETLIRIARDRLSKHRDLDALADALHEVPRSVPFDGMAELEGLDIPALVVASHDEADPGHPHSVAQAYVEALPRARMISEEEGESPLAWQGGKLSREIAAFCEEDQVRERVSG